MLHVPMHEGASELLCELETIALTNYYHGTEVPTLESPLVAATFAGYPLALPHPSTGTVVIVTTNMEPGSILLDLGWVSSRYGTIFDLMSGLNLQMNHIRHALQSNEDGRWNAHLMQMRRHSMVPPQAEAWRKAIGQQIDAGGLGEEEKQLAHEMLELAVMFDSLDRPNVERWIMTMSGIINSMLHMNVTLREYQKLTRVLYDAVLAYIKAMSEKLRTTVDRVNDMIRAPWANLDRKSKVTPSDWDQLARAKRTIIEPLMRDISGVSAEPFNRIDNGILDCLERMNGHVEQILKDRPTGEDLHAAMETLRSLAVQATLIGASGVIWDVYEPCRGLISAIAIEKEMDCDTEVGLANLQRRAKSARERAHLLIDSLNKSINVAHLKQHANNVALATERFLRMPGWDSKANFQFHLGALSRHYIG